MNRRYIVEALDFMLWVMINYPQVYDHWARDNMIVGLDDRWDKSSG